MKTKIIALLVTGLLAMNFAFADGNKKAPKEKPQNPSQIITQKITYPEFAIEQGISAEVRVSFTIDETGHIKVIQANCVNQELLNYFVNELSKIKFDPETVETGKVYYSKYTFSLQ